MLATPPALAALLAAVLGLGPDTVYYDAVVHTVDDDNPVASAIAIEGDRIVYVGTTTRALALADRQTELIDLDGATILPGLIDAHGHLALLGQLELGVIDLAGTGSYDEVIELVRAAADDAPPGTWILGRGWDHESWPSRALPHHRLLSDAVPDHPVWLGRVDGHAGLANARAMREAGIDASTAAPTGGELIRTDSGEPTGVLIDNAEALIERVVPAGARASTRDLILAGQRMCLGAGLTGVHDMGVSGAQAELYKEMERSGELRLRVYALVGGPAAMRYFDEHDPYDGDRLSVRACKLYMDGAMGSRGAWLLEPYADRPVGPDGAPYVGLNTLDPELVQAVAEHALDRGYQVCTHAIGDRGNRAVLDAYQRALDAAGRSGTDHRFRVEHAQLLAPDDIPRFAELGVIPSMQQRHATSDMRWVEARVGPDRAKGAYAWRSLLDTGVVIAGGSDFPVEPHNPFWTFYAAITRQDHAGSPAGGWLPEERMTRPEALRSLTIWAAHAAFQEDRLGSLRRGKQADFVVIDRDVMRIPPAEILGTQVLRTVVAGRAVYAVDEDSVNGSDRGGTGSGGD